MKNGSPKTRDTAPSVLIVDDDSDFRRVLGEALADEGYRIVEAVNGKEALDRLAFEHPQLILVDLLMPTMSGLELLQKVRKTPTLRAIPVVVITAANDAMLSVKLDVPVIYKGDIETVLRVVRRSLPSPGEASAQSAKV
ncbi:MAG TPA: response regulator [Polyangia bacterium]|jgi:CheY-like chemotaxis protein|nr:response regulator [Polyangia bacterium]